MKVQHLIFLSLIITASTLKATGNNMAQADIDAQHYKENSSVQFRLAEDILGLHQFRSDEDILDVGCGDGKLTVKLSEKVPHGCVDGIDPSPAMVQLAAETHPLNKFSNLHFQIGSAENFQADKKYDLITVFSCLHWVRGQEHAIKHMTKALKDHGKLLMLTFPKESSYWRVLEEVIYRPKWQKYAGSSACQHWVSSEEYKRIAHDLKLKEIYLHTSHENASYQDKNHFKEYVKGWLPCLISIPENLHEDFLDDLAIHAEDKYGEVGKTEFSIPYDKIVMYLEKS